jgi:uncharacterized protein YukJ
MQTQIDMPKAEIQYQISNNLISDSLNIQTENVKKQFQLGIGKWSHRSEMTGKAESIPYSISHNIMQNTGNMKMKWAYQNGMHVDTIHLQPFRLI